MSRSDTLLPPAIRTPNWKEISLAAKTGRFVLPKCMECRTIQYPPQEICTNCLSENLEWSEIDSLGKVLAFTYSHTSLEGFFLEHTPWSFAFVKLDSGPRLYTHITKNALQIAQRVKVLSLLDQSGEAIFLAVPEADESQDYLEEFEHLLLTTKL